MKKEQADNLRDLKWKYTLNSAEEIQVQQYLSAHPDERAEWVEEARLNELLSGLPDAPLASNFTARVLQAVELESSKESRKRVQPAWRVGLGWVSRLAMAGSIGLVTFVALHQHQASQRMQLAQSVARVSTASLPPEWLQDFDTIKNLNKASAVDDELLAALK